MNKTDTGKAAKELKIAYEWALNQQYTSVAARYARILAEHIRNVTNLSQDLGEAVHKAFEKRIKAAEKKRGEGVLELACGTIYDYTDKVSVGAAGLLGDVRNKVRQAYKERYEQL